MMVSAGVARRRDAPAKPQFMHMNTKQEKRGKIARIATSEAGRAVIYRTFYARFAKADQVCKSSVGHTHTNLIF